MATGFVAGTITGAFLGHNVGAALWVGCWGLGLGAAVGAAIGSVKISIPIHGDQAKFNENRKKLRSYALNYRYTMVPPAHFTRMQNNVTDTDGNVYHTLALAGQVWMARNLIVTHYRNGETITNIKANGDWRKAAAGATCNYVNDSSVSNNNGNLYNWNAMNDKRGLCPKGWHVPSLSEWSSLVTCLGGESAAGKRLAEAIPAVTGSLSEDPFALPGRFRYANGEYSSAKGLSYQWWSSTPADNLTGKAFYMGNADGGIMFTNTDKQSGLPVRCLRD
ncbi:MAG: fibrobacter succinogenes major paralogous domain-containing protein [Bacteroidetes bacterium]|nr:fibrobacter succinogenes major paralogous domain-containing protein [Bacteroidota bacterium]